MNNLKSRDIYIIGVTGKTACGKTTVAKMLSKKLERSFVYDIDLEAKNIYKKNKSVLLKLREYFGNSIFLDDNNIDFKKLALIVFNSKIELEKLNRIMIPLIDENVKKFVSKLKKENNWDFLIIDAAILFSLDIYNYCNFIILVKSNIKKRCKLLMEKNLINLNEALIRIKGQYIKIKKNNINYIVENTKDLESLENEVDKVKEIILKDYYAKNS